MGKWLFANGRNARELEIDVEFGDLKQSEMYAKLHGKRPPLYVLTLLYHRHKTHVSAKGLGEKHRKTWGKTKKRRM